MEDLVTLRHSKQQRHRLLTVFGFEARRDGRCPAYRPACIAPSWGTGALAPRNAPRSGELREPPRCNDSAGRAAVAGPQTECPGYDVPFAASLEGNDAASPEKAGRGHPGHHADAVPGGSGL